MERINKTSTTTMQDLFDSYDPAAIHSTPGVRTDLYHRQLDSVRITDFFGGVAQVELTHSAQQDAAAAALGGIDLTF
jgi:phosphatidylinositol glycan class K